MMKGLYFALVSRRDASALLIACAVISVYANSLDNAFQFDDRHSIVENPHLRSIDNIPAFFSHPEYFSRDADKAMYRPLLLSTFALNYAWGKYRVSSYHLINIGLHLACALLLWGVLRHLQQPPCMSLLGALFFAVHPLATEPVNYISSRSELMAAAGVLSGLLLYVRAEEKGTVFYSIGSAVCFAAGLMSKSVALILPMWIVVWQWQSGNLASGWRRLWPYALIALAYLAVVQRFLLKAVFAAPVRTWPEQLATQVKALVYYVMLLFAPFKLNVDHSFYTSNMLEPVVWLSGLVAASLFLRVGGLARMGVLWILLALLPTLLVPLNVLVNEHRLYLPLVGLVVALLGLRSLESVPGLRWGAPFLLVLLASLSIERNRVWSDEHSLWSDAASKNPNSVRPHVYLGNAARQRGYPEVAKQHYQRALQLESKNPTVLANLANVYQDLQRYDLAVDAFTQVLAENPAMTDVHYSLGRALQFAGRFAEAQEQYNALPPNSPHRVFADNNLGTLHERAGRLDSALTSYDRAIALEQARNNKHRLLALSLQQIKQMLDGGQLERAEAQARMLLTAPIDHRDARFLLAVALFLQRRYDESIAVNQQLVNDHPGFDEGWLQLALVQESSGRFAEALISYQRLRGHTLNAEMRNIAADRQLGLEERMP